MYFALHFFCRVYVRRGEILIILGIFKERKIPSVVELLSSNAAIYYIKHLDSHCIFTTVLGTIALVKKRPVMSDNLANKPLQVHFFSKQFQIDLTHSQYINAFETLSVPLYRFVWLIL